MRHRKLNTLLNEIETSKGKWEITPHHEVVYTAKGPPPEQKEVLVRGSLIAAEPEALVLSVSSKEDKKRTVTGLVKLKGRWKLDPQNRIQFEAKRALDQKDKLTFQGLWKVNDRHQVVYSYETKEVLKGKGKRRRRVRKSVQELVFKGSWDISGKNRLTYLIGGDSDSAFRFRGTFQTKSIFAKEGEIRYQAGVEIRKQTAAGRLRKPYEPITIVLFGKWKISRDYDISFELESASGEKQTLLFGFSYFPDVSFLPPSLVPDEIKLHLKSQSGHPLGLELILTKDFFDNVQTFVRFVKSVEESRLEAGVKVAW